MKTVIFNSFREVSLEAN